MKNLTLLTRNYAATSQRIAGISRRTNASRIVTDYSTFWISSASSHTGILTFEIETSLRRTAFRVGNAFWSTFRGHTQVSRLARADRWASNRSTNTIGTARCGGAGLLSHTWWSWLTFVFKFLNILHIIFWEIGFVTVTLVRNKKIKKFIWDPKIIVSN